MTWLAAVAVYAAGFLITYLAACYVHGKNDGECFGDALLWPIVWAFIVPYVLITRAGEALARAARRRRIAREEAANARAMAELELERLTAEAMPEVERMLAPDTPRDVTLTEARRIAGERARRMRAGRDLLNSPSPF